jgi:hypothetical protein
MRRSWRGLKLMLVIAVTAVGCSSRDIAMKPPKHPEEIAVPPVEDGKFSKPPQYPDGTLNQGDPTRAQNGGAPNLNAMNGMGSRGGMGGNGMGGIPPNMGGGGGMGMGR